MQAPPMVTRQRQGRACKHPQTARTPNHKTMTVEEQNKLADIITANIIGCTKEVLTSDEASKYMGVSRSYLYKLTMRKEIPHYKSPTGKMCYFNRSELEQWLQSNRVATGNELADRAQHYCNQKGVGL